MIVVIPHKHSTKENLKKLKEKFPQVTTWLASHDLATAYLSTWRNNLPERDAAELISQINKHLLEALL